MVPQWWLFLLGAFVGHWRLILRWKGDFSPKWRFAITDWERLSFIKQKCLSKTLGLFINFMFAQTQRHWMFLSSILQSIGSELGGGSPRRELLPGKRWSSGLGTNYIVHGRADTDPTDNSRVCLTSDDHHPVDCNIQQWPVSWVKPL